MATDGCVTMDELAECWSSYLAGDRLSQGILGCNLSLETVAGSLGWSGGNAHTTSGVSGAWRFGETNSTFAPKAGGGVHVQVHHFGPA